MLPMHLPWMCDPSCSPVWEKGVVPPALSPKEKDGACVKGIYLAPQSVN